MNSLAGALLVFALLALGFISGCTVFSEAPAVQGRRIQAEGLPLLGPYSHAVQAHGFLFLSGVIAIDPQSGGLVEEDITRQTHQVFDNIRTVLAAGGASLADVVKVVVFLKNPQDFPAMNAVYATYFEGLEPARTTVPGVDWGPGVLIEIDVTAVVD